MTIYQAARDGDAAAVRRLLDADARLATVRDGDGWDALTHLCFSEKLLEDRSTSAAFVETARALLDAGASATTGYEEGDVFESVLYGAAGRAHDAALTRLLLERGADPNDDEVPYHSPETYDNAAVQALIDSGRLSEISLAMMLLRKCDWHDEAGAALLLAHGADPSAVTRWGYTALHQAIRRDNSVAMIELLLNHGADPNVVTRGQPIAMSALSMAAWHGRADVLRVFQGRHIPVAFEGLERLLAACALDDAAAVKEMAGDSSLRHAVQTHAGLLLLEFAGIGNSAGVAHLLDLGADLRVAMEPGDGYWGIAEHATALHVAAWRARHDTVTLLIERGADVNARDQQGQTPLMLAVRACVDSYWTRLRAPESVAALLDAGATTDGIAMPTGYDAIDTLLSAAARARA